MPGRLVCLSNTAPVGTVPGAGCLEDGLEPNDDPQAARTLPGDGVDAGPQTVNLGLCNGREDWFRLPMGVAQGLGVALDSTAAGADLQMELYDGEQDLPVAYSRSRADPRTGYVPSELVALSYEYVGREYLLRVFPAVGTVAAPAGYSLRVERTPGGTCALDVAEPNHSAGTAAPWPPQSLPDRRPLTACAGPPDFFALAATTTGVAQVRVRPRADGQLLTGVETAAGTPLFPDGGVPDGLGQHLFTFPVQQGEAFLLRVQHRGAQSAGTDYDVDLLDGFCTDDLDEPDNSEAQARPAQTGSTGIVCGSNADYLVLQALRDGPLKVVVHHDRPYGPLTLIVFKPQNEAVPDVATVVYNAQAAGAEVELNAQAGETYFLRIGNAAQQGATPWSLVLEGPPVCQDPGDEGPAGDDTVQTAQLLAEGQSGPQVLCGPLELDHFRYVAPVTRTDERLVVEHEAGLALDVVLTDEAGAPLAAVTEVDARGNTVVRFNAVQGTSYVLGVAASALQRVVHYQVVALPPTPQNDACDAAVVLPTNGMPVTGSTRGAANDVSLLNVDCTGYGTQGPDVFYRVAIPAGATLTVALADLTGRGADGALYLLDGCAEKCCWAGADRAGAGGAETLVYNNLTGASQNLLLGVDQYNAGLGGTDFVLTAVLNGL